MSAQTVRVRGLREFVRASHRAGREASTEVREALKESGEVVEQEWASRLRFYDSKTAAGLRVRASTKGVSVVQSLRKSQRASMRRPKFGGLQMRLGLAALEDKQSELEDAAEKALDRIVDHFERG